jgi:N-acetylmuramic acid 6-phosphate (MurNAc-6-P) etherase
MMVNLKPTNAKLRERMVGIVAEIRKVNLDEARKLLDLAGWNIRACVQK